MTTLDHDRVPAKFSISPDFATFLLSIAAFSTLVGLLCAAYFGGYDLTELTSPDN
ncbi:MAG: hypothetical protein AAB955_01110 [Patescibacteria group bacterium]